MRNDVTNRICTGYKQVVIDIHGLCTHSFIAAQNIIDEFKLTKGYN